jgi:hypothetical protein
VGLELQPRLGTLRRVDHPVDQRPVLDRRVADPLFALAQQSRMGEGL